MFSFIKNKLTKVYQQFTCQVHALFSRTFIDQQTIKELEKLLIQADIGVKTTEIIIDQLQAKVANGTIGKGIDLHHALHNQLIAFLDLKQPAIDAPVTLLVGINGSGKTTFAAKLAYHYKTQGNKVLLVAADTFRAAAVEQLDSWAKRAGVDIVTGATNQDPASVVFQGCELFKTGKFDRLLIDTAGRLQTKEHLMRELEKIKKIITRQLPTTPLCTLLTVDAMLGQNSFTQAKIFNQSTQLDGIVLTKMDGTGKGGIVFAITQELNIPVAYISYGETIDAFKLFDAQSYVEQLLSQ